MARRVRLYGGRRKTAALPRSSRIGQRPSRRLTGVLTLANSRSATGIGVGRSELCGSEAPGRTSTSVTEIRPRAPPAPGARPRESPPGLLNSRGPSPVRPSSRLVPFGKSISAIRFSWGSETTNRPSGRAMTARTAPKVVGNSAPTSALSTPPAASPPLRSAWPSAPSRPRTRAAAGARSASRSAAPRGDRSTTPPSRGRSPRAAGS